MIKKFFRGLVFLFFLATLIHIVISINKIIATSAPDFNVLWLAAKDLLPGRNPYLNQEIFTSVGYPPNTLLFYLPFVNLSGSVAQAFFILLSFGSIVTSVFLAFKIVLGKVPFFGFLIALSLTFLSFPTKFTLGMGQNNSIVFLLLLLSYYLYKEKKLAVSGILLGFAVAFKTVFGFFLLFFLLKREKQIVLYSLLALTVLILITVLIGGTGLYSYYIKEIIPPLLNLTGREIYYNQGLLGFVSRLFTNLELRKYLGIVLSFVVVLVCSLLTAKKGPRDLQFSIFIIALLLIDSLSWQHHFVWLIFPFILLTNYAIRKKKVGYLLLIGVSYFLVSWNIKVPLVFSDFPRSLLLSNTFYGTFILFLLNTSLLLSNVGSNKIR